MPAMASFWPVGAAKGSLSGRSAPTSLFLLRSFRRLQGLRSFSPLLDPQEHPPLHDEVLPLHKQVVEHHVPHTRLEPTSLPQEQARAPLVDLFHYEGPSTSFLGL